MSRKLVCDGCGHDAPETNEEKQRWSRFHESKLEQKLTTLHEWELCPDCSQLTLALISRLNNLEPLFRTRLSGDDKLLEMSGGSKPKEE